MDSNLDKDTIVAWFARNRSLSLLILFLVLLMVALLSSASQATAFVIAAFALPLGALIGRVDRHARAAMRHAEPQDPLLLVSAPELLAVYKSFRHSLILLSRQKDEILQEAAHLELATMQEQLRTLASGKVVFLGTESWRTVYERILRSPGLSRYLSVAWLRDEDYWRDAPGRHSMQLNYELLERGLRIERTLILNDFYWPPAANLPAKSICTWIEEQHKRGIVMRLVRESEIVEEPDLMSDIGIYGDRACGLLELDDQCQTVRFTLDFDPRSVQRYEERWRRLLLFAVNFRELVDQNGRGG
jgi:hypothetical protein